VGADTNPDWELPDRWIEEAHKGLPAMGEESSAGRSRPKEQRDVNEGAAQMNAAALEM
jgi:hypothetical protein